MLLIFCCVYIHVNIWKLVIIKNVFTHKKMTSLANFEICFTKKSVNRWFFHEYGKFWFFFSFLQLIRDNDLRILNSQGSAVWRSDDLGIVNHNLFFYTLHRLYITKKWGEFYWLTILCLMHFLLCVLLATFSPAMLLV